MSYQDILQTESRLKGSHRSGNLLSFLFLLFFFPSSFPPPHRPLPPPKSAQGGGAEKAGVFDSNLVITMSLVN
jgi:hypothetical protein